MVKTGTVLYINNVLIMNLLETTVNKLPSLVVRYRHQKYISIECDARTGRVKASEASDGCSEGDCKHFNLTSFLW